MKRFLQTVALVGSVALGAAPLHAESLREQALSTMKETAKFYRTEIASHGGYVYFTTLDDKQRWGEGLATPDRIWVQPPSTPTVGLAYLRAYEATGDKFFLQAAVDAAEALVYGQLRSGGWTNSIDFDPKGNTALYRNGKGRGKNNSSLDDGQTQSALLLLIEVDRTLNARNKKIHEATRVGLDALLAAQFPNGAFPQVWTGPVAKQPILEARYPDHDWRSEGRIKEYWNQYTLNDNVAGYVARTLHAAHRAYGGTKYLAALEKLGDFLLLAQMPEPQPAWAQQYNYDMEPIWARRFEPAGISGDESQEVVETLLFLSAVTAKDKYLEPIPAALRYLKRSLLKDGRLARFYELKSNKPLYMFRKGKTYTLTYDDSNLPKHYGWKIESRLDELAKLYQDRKSGKPWKTPPTIGELETKVKKIIASTNKGQWISTYNGERLVGQPKMKLGTKYLSSQVFSDNLEALAEYLILTKKP